MGILDRFARSLKANVNSLIDKAEDPAKVIAQTIEDMQDELKKAKQEHVQALASVKQLERKVADHVKESEDWERKAMLALEHGDEELAREALRRKKKSEADAVEADRLRGQQAQYAEDIKTSIDAMEKKVDELKARRSSLAAAVARSRSTPGADPLSDSSSGPASPALAKLKEMQDKIENLEAEAEAHNLLDDPKKADLEERFRKLEKGEKKDQLDDEIAALKARLKK
jgi:phage shock protein A